MPSASSTAELVLNIAVGTTTKALMSTQASFITVGTIYMLLKKLLKEPKFFYLVKLFTVGVNALMESKNHLDLVLSHESNSMEKRRCYKA